MGVVTVPGEQGSHEECAKVKTIWSSEKSASILGKLPKETRPRQESMLLYLSVLTISYVPDLGSGDTAEKESMKTWRLPFIREDRQ
jgi:hypothetical protein